MSTQGPHQPSSEQLLAHRDQLRHIISRLRVTLRYAWIGAIIVVAITGASVYFAKKSKRQFTSKAVVLYRQMIQASDIGTERRGGSFLDLGTQLQEILLTRPRLSALIKEYDLYPKTVAVRGFGPAVDELRQGLQIRITTGNTIHIQFVADTPKVAQGVVASLANALIEEESRLRTEQASVTVKFLEGERKRATEDLHNKEQALAKFLAAHPEFIAEAASGNAMAAAGAEGGAGGAMMRGGGRRTPRAGRSTSGDATLLALERQAARIRAQLKGGGQAPPPSPTAPASDSEMDSMTRAASDEVREAKRQLEQRQAQFTDLHPDVKAARQRLADAQARLRRLKQMGRPVVQAVAPAAGGSNNEEALNAALAKVTHQIEARRRRSGAEKEAESEKAADDVVSLEVEWTRLNRVVSEARSRVLSLEGRQFRASLASNSEQSQASQMQIIDPAFLPTQPSGRGRGAMVMMGFGAAVLLASLVMLGLAFVDDRIYDRSDIQRLGTAPLLIVLPRIKAGKRGRSRQAPPRAGPLRPGQTAQVPK